MHAPYKEQPEREESLLNLDRLVFIDKPLATTTMTRPHGRDPKPERTLASGLQGRWKTKQFLAE